jgi:CysZ protein
MKNFVAGARTLGAGFGLLARSPRLLALGALPALVTSVLLLVALGSLGYFSADLAAGMTPFADGWPEFWRGSLRVLLAVLLVGGGVLVGSVSFVALTLLVGGPFYEHIAERAERGLGLDAGGDGAGWWRSAVRGLRDTVRLVLLSAVGAVLLGLLGLLPVVGQLAAPVLGALFGAWMISLEMVGLVFLRRGLRLGDRHRALRRHASTVLGFGLPAYLLCLVPVAQLVVVPAAVVGGTLLAHRVLGPARPEPATAPPHG